MFINTANRVANIFIGLKDITSKMHNTSVSIVFIKTDLFVDVIPRSTEIEGLFVNENDHLLLPLVACLWAQIMVNQK